MEPIKVYEIGSLNFQCGHEISATMDRIHLCEECLALARCGAGFEHRGVPLKRKDYKSFAGWVHDEDFLLERAKEVISIFSQRNPSGYFLIRKGLSPRRGRFLKSFKNDQPEWTSYFAEAARMDADTATKIYALMYMLCQSVHIQGTILKAGASK